MRRLARQSPDGDGDAHTDAHPDADRDRHGDRSDRDRSHADAGAHTDLGAHADAGRDRERNGVVEGDEQCDGADLDLEDCGTLCDNGAGTLQCTAQCTFDFSRCDDPASCSPP